MKKPPRPAFVLEGNPDAPEPLTREQLAELIRQPSHRGFRVLPRQTVKIKQQQDNIQFAAMVEAMDESLGRVLAKLKALKLEENTIVIFFSDNGGMSAANFGNPRRATGGWKSKRRRPVLRATRRGAKGWLYEGGIRVPLIVKWPGQSPPGIVCEEPVISTDFFPSILEMAGLPAQPRQHLDGVSFVPALKGKPFERDAIYWHFPHYSNDGMQSPGGAIRLGDYKLLEYFENNTLQLFNLKNDLGEQNDLARAQPKKAAELRAKLQAWRKEVSAQMIPAKPN
jgi:arylsulfatase A-like enzyme